jgi:hypothetical protein
MIASRIPRDGDQRSELMSITIPEWVRVPDGVTDPLGGSRQNISNARNEINQIAEIRNHNKWLLVSIRTLQVFSFPRSNNSAHDAGGGHHEMLTVNEFQFGILHHP